MAKPRLRYCFIGDRKNFRAPEPGPGGCLVHWISSPVRKEDEAWLEFRRFAQMAKWDVRVLGILKVVDAYECNVSLICKPVDDEN